MSSAAVIRFPMRCAACIRLMHEADGAWLVLAYSHGWLHGDRRAALADARWLGRNLGLPVRETEDRPPKERS
jgi:hypothetical protein